MTTNKAFIDAYQSSFSKPAVSSIDTDPLIDAFFGTEPTTTSETPIELRVPRIDPPQGAVRRPLSAVQADEFANIGGPTVSACTPQWPVLCQQLLAQAADRYDAVLRQLPQTSTAALIGVVGATPQAGCTTTAICLALRSAALGFAAALVDGNFASGDLARTIQVEQYSSWGALLGSSMSIATAIQTADDVGLDLLLTDALRESGLESTARFRASLAAGVLRRKYQQVIIDLGCPTETGAGLLADLSTAMGVDFLIATTSPSTTQANLDNITTTLGDHGLQISGVIEAV